MDLHKDVQDLGTVGVTFVATSLKGTVAENIDLIAVGVHRGVHRSDNGDTGSSSRCRSGGREEGKGEGADESEGGECAHFGIRWLESWVGEWW